MSTRLYSILTTAVLLLAILLPPLARAQNASQQLAAASVLETIKKRGAIRVDRLCGGHCTAGGPVRRDHQQSASRHP